MMPLVEGGLLHEYVRKRSTPMALEAGAAELRIEDRRFYPCDNHRRPNHEDGRRERDNGSGVQHTGSGDSHSSSNRFDISFMGV